MDYTHITSKDLKEILSKFPDDAEVFVNWVMANGDVYVTNNISIVFDEKENRIVIK
jgi:hypothetical protein